MSARIRVRKEQNIVLVSTSDPDLAIQLCHVQTLKIGSRLYEVSAYVASPDNFCKGVITGALPIPTEDALMNDTVTYPQNLSDQSPKCATAASELATDTTSAHIHRNTGVEIVAFSTQVNTRMVASLGVKPVAPTNTPPSTWVAQLDKGDLGPVFLEMNASS
ncbi:hypothetical protein HPB51_017440 [Rhipicephalus microplus]|uniref:Uncharacterized protein n=1 Tax=Rhipicephalus microplus TaxID=6941 RepID=A0A9J6E373_RHIMP|nr:hypothetical protein HPB51_017440 [Rhipicephalus microplus]